MFTLSFGGVRVAHLVFGGGFFRFVFVFRPVSCVPNVAGVSGISILDFLAPSGFSNVYLEHFAIAHVMLTSSLVIFLLYHDNIYQYFFHFSFYLTGDVFIINGTTLIQENIGQYDVIHTTLPMKSQF